MYQPPKPKALHFWEFCNRIQLGRGLHSACCELDYKMCSLRRLVCWGEIWELFWVWSWSQLKKWKPTLEKIFIGEDEISPNELYNHPFCLWSLSEDLHCSYCWRWWFLGKKFTTDLKLGEFRKEWNEFGEHIKSACCFMALAGQKKKQNKRLFEELQCFFLCFFRNLRIFRSEIGGRRNWQNSDAERRKCQLKHILKVKIGWLYSQCQKEKCENRP